MATHETVAIRWVAGHVKEARGYAMFFDGRTIFSYGRHYAIARFVETSRGTVCLFNSEGYSVSTAKHRTITARALRRFRPDMPVYAVPFVQFAEEPGAHMANYLDLCRRAYEARDKAKRARVYKASYLSEAASLDAQAWDYAALFGIEETAALAA
jgi:hypothetical protein